MKQTVKKTSFVVALCAATVITGFAGTAQAEDNFIFTPHQSVAGEAFVKKLDTDEKYELRRYLDYEYREPCQNYREPPEGFKRVRCDLFFITPAPQVVIEPKQSIQTAMVQKREVLSSYVINFGFDSAAVSGDADATLARVAKEIVTYKPGEVTVSGYADTAGPNKYNMILSANRAQAVSNALTNRGVAHKVIDREAFGETNLAVPTADNVPLEQNRRVIVEFLK